jgi:hypothetical protein
MSRDLNMGAVNQSYSGNGNGYYNTPIHGGNKKQLLQEFEFEIYRVREDNASMRNKKEISERKLEKSMYENNSLLQKLENLENVFIGKEMEKGKSAKAINEISREYKSSNVRPIHHYFF